MLIYNGHRRRRVPAEFFPADIRLMRTEIRRLIRLSRYGWG